MMTETLSSLFQKSHGAAIEIDGRFVRQIFQEKIGCTRKRFLVRRIGSAAYPIQGLRIKAVKGSVEINGESHSEVVLWADTSPVSVEIAVTSKSGCDLKAWNVWKIEDAVQAWVGNSGILVSKLGAVITLECSDGTGEINFTDLIMQIEEFD
jgi:hypothetical protein